MKMRYFITSVIAAAILACLYFFVLVPKARNENKSRPVTGQTQNSTSTPETPAAGPQVLIARGSVSFPSSTSTSTPVTSQ